MRVENSDIDGYRYKVQISYVYLWLSICSIGRGLDFYVLEDYLNDFYPQEKILITSGYLYLSHDLLIRNLVRKVHNWIVYSVIGFITSNDISGELGFSEVFKCHISLDSYQLVLEDLNGEKNKTSVAKMGIEDLSNLYNFLFRSMMYK